MSDDEEEGPVQRMNSEGFSIMQDGVGDENHSDFDCSGRSSPISPLSDTQHPDDEVQLDAVDSSRRDRSASASSASSAASRRSSASPLAKRRRRIRTRSTSNSSGSKSGSEDGPERKYDDVVENDDAPDNDGQQIRRRRLSSRSSSTSSRSSSAERSRRRRPSYSSDSDSNDGDADKGAKNRPEVVDDDQEESGREEEEEDGAGASQSGMIDFDLMLERKRQENRRYRKKKDIQLINDNDDAIARLIADMRQAAREDRDLNTSEQPATRKMSMLPEVTRALGKVDLQLAFVEANVLSVMTDWLAPMPRDNSLPHVQIRTTFLRYLKELPIDDLSRLKESGIGKAVMYLYRHPRETRGNKDTAGKIVARWSRPIFNLCTDFSTMTREERQRRDQEMKERLDRVKRRARQPAAAAATAAGKKGEEAERPLRPGDPGWVCRARVPMPDIKEFVVRPEWQSHEDLDRSRPKEMSLLEKHKRRFADKRKVLRHQHAVKLSLEGKNMTL